MPDKPDPALYDIIEAGDGTHAVVFAGTNDPVIVDGFPQVGLDIRDAYDVAESLEAIAHITTSQSKRTVH